MDSHLVTMAALGEVAANALKGLRRAALVGRHEPAAVTAYGDALRALVGPVPARDLEVLLDLDADPALADHAWDLCAAGAPEALTYTRLVTPVVAPRTVPAPREPLKVLFVVARGLEDPRVRPTNEYLGVIRACGREGVGIHVVPLFDATERTLAEQVRAIQPAVVHLVAHGKAGGKLLIGGSDGATVELDGLSLALALSAADAPPWLVVLNACYSGGGGTSAEEPLAAALVRRGIPAVVAMGDAVADRAARAFAWRFYDALVAGDPLPLAVAQARRAVIASGFSPAGSVEWARPSLFRSRAAPLSAAEDPAWKVRAGVVAALRKDGGPRLLGDRAWLFDVPYRWLTQERREAVALLTTPAEHLGRGQVGRTRALVELGAALVRDGHLVVHVPQPTATRLIGDAMTQVKQAVLTTRRRHGLDHGIAVAMGLLRRAEFGEPVGLPAAVHDAWLDNNKVWSHPETARAALRHDLAKLAADAEGAGLIAPDARVFLLIDELARWDGAAPLMAALVGRLDAYAIPGHLVSALVTAGPSGGAGGDEAASKAVKELANGSSEFRDFPIGPFSQADAEVAIAHWLLGYEPEPLWWDPGLDETRQKKTLAALLATLQGTPGRYAQLAGLIDAFYTAGNLAPAADRVAPPPVNGG